MTPDQFASTYLNKKVTHLGRVLSLPCHEFVVTAALFQFEGSTSIFAIKSIDYSPENKWWFTIKIAPENFEAIMSDFKLIEEND